MRKRDANLVKDLRPSKTTLFLMGNAFSDRGKKMMLVLKVILAGFLFLVIVGAIAGLNSGVPV